MSNTAYSSAEARHLAEDTPRCERCGDPILDGFLCAPCEDDEAEAAKQAAEEREDQARWKAAHDD